MFPCLAWFQKQRATFRCYSLNPCVGPLPFYAVSATARACGQVVLSVVRTHPKVSFDVNATGVYNACKAAIAHGHTRLVNTGPWSVTPPMLFLFLSCVAEEHSPL